MRPINCPVCARQCSPEADRCPQCSHPIKRGFLGRAGTERTFNVIVASVVVVMLLAWCSFGGSMYPRTAYVAPPVHAPIGDLSIFEQPKPRVQPDDPLPADAMYFAAAAKLLKCSADTIWKAVRDGELKSYRGQVSRAELEQWAERRRAIMRADDAPPASQPPG